MITRRDLIVAGVSVALVAAGLALAQSVSQPVMHSCVFNWANLKPVPTKPGARRTVFNAPTPTLANFEAHVTTLNPGAISGPPRLHLHEEVIIVKEGLIEATCDGRKQTVGPGSVIFFAAHATTSLKNVGTTPATYTVVYYLTPLTPKS